MGSQAGDGYKSTEIFLVIMVDLSAVGISMYPYHVKEEYQLSEAVHYENFALFYLTVFFWVGALL